MIVRCNSYCFFRSDFYTGTLLTYKSNKMATTSTMPAPVRGFRYEQKRKLLQQFPILSEADLKFEEGKKDAMIEKICKKIGKTKDEFYVILALL